VLLVSPVRFALTLALNCPCTTSHPDPTVRNATFMVTDSCRDCQGQDLLVGCLSAVAAARLLQGPAVLVCEAVKPRLPLAPLSSLAARISVPNPRSVPQASPT
jgi:hypothetical protein